ASLTVKTTALTIGDHAVWLIVSVHCVTLTTTAKLTAYPDITPMRPPAATVCPGTDASFSTVASGTGPITYQWSLDGAASGSNAASLSVNTTALTIGDHTVRLIVSGQCSSVTNSATLKVNAGITASAPTDAT